MTWQEMILRVGFAALCGIIIGFERERSHQFAGIKTHMLVCVSAALISMIQTQVIQDVIDLIATNPALADSIKSDYGRMGAQVISGIGFIGAGAIIHNKGSIKGLTTAATLWIVAGIGLAVGLGYYLMSTIVVSIVELLIVLIRLFQNLFQKKRGSKLIEITMCDKQLAMIIIKDYCSKNAITIDNIALVEMNEVVLANEKSKAFTYQYTLNIPRFVKPEKVLTELQLEAPIISASMVNSI